ncbi:MAG: right-handed parallel beta-helix repeat-containing protein [Nitrospirota bacterium]
MKRFLGFVGVLGVLLLGWANLGFCGTVTVTGTDTVFTTIQAGVNACPVGGTVSVAAGTYIEAVYINKRIALVGAGSNSTTITAQGISNTNTVTFAGIATNNASISGFKITGATWDEGSDEISGAGIYCTNGSPTITNNTILGNDCGIACEESSPSITNNTISGNGGVGIYCENSSSPTITNNIITSNGTTSSNYYGIYVYSGNPGTPIIDYNCVWGNGSGGENYYYCNAGTHDISFNPQFIGGGDFHLQSTSPCIDKGSNTAPSIPSTDKDGKPRIVDGIVDMGAYEYQGAQLPSPDIKANGADGPIDITPTDTLAVTIKFEAGNFTGQKADWWAVAETPFGWFYYSASTNSWQQGFSYAYQGPLFNLSPYNILNISGLPKGSYTIYFGVDLIMNGVIDFGSLYYDSVKVNVK